MLNSVINKLPFELHIPGYRYCGPGTKLKKRLERGDKGINGLDEACREHDIAYSQEKNLEERHKADKILAEKALVQFRSKSAGLKEKIAALGVAGAMKTKVKFGMGLNSNNYKLVVNKCRRELNKVKSSMERLSENINRCVQILNNENLSPTKKKYKYISKKKIQNKKTTKKEKNNNMDIDISDDYPMGKTVDFPPSPPLTSRPRKVAKRKFIEENFEDVSSAKKVKIDFNEPLSIPATHSRKTKKRKYESSEEQNSETEEEDENSKKSKTI